MEVVRTISTLIIPAVLICVLVVGLMKKTEVYTCFLEGAKDGIQVTVGVIPALIGLVVAINMLKGFRSHRMGRRVYWDPILKWIGMPGELLPLALLRPVSGSGSLELSKIFCKHMDRIHTRETGKCDDGLYGNNVLYGSDLFWSSGDQEYPPYIKGSFNCGSDCNAQCSDCYPHLFFNINYFAQILSMLL